jgi:hypothetical protein
MDGCSGLPAGDPFRQHPFHPFIQLVQPLKQLLVTLVELQEGIELGGGVGGHCRSPGTGCRRTVAFPSRESSAAFAERKATNRLLGQSDAGGQPVQPRGRYSVTDLATWQLKAKIDELTATVE